MVQAACLADLLQSGLRSGPPVPAFQRRARPAAAAAHWNEAHRAIRGAEKLTIDARAVTALDSGGAALLVLPRGPEAEWREPGDATARGALTHFRNGLATAPPPAKPKPFRPLTAIGAATLALIKRFLGRMGFLGETTLAVLRVLPRPGRCAGPS